MMLHRTLLGLFVFASLNGSAATYHVAIGGSDAHTGLSVVNAFATVQHAAAVALAGDTVLVHDGHYQGFAAMDHSGNATDPIVFRALGSNTVIDVACSYNNLDGINVENVSWVVVDGFHVEDMPRAGIRSALSDHVTIRNNTCTGNGTWGIFTGFAEHVIIEHNECAFSVEQHGIYFSNSSDHPIVRYNHLHDNNSCGIHMNGDESQGGDGVISDAQVYGNIINGNGAAGGSGINCDGVINSTIFNNVLYDNHASGISLYMIDAAVPSTGNRIFNNTILNADDSRWCINITEGCTDNQVFNNILINAHPWHGSVSCDASALSGFQSDFNLVMNSFTTTDGDDVRTLAQWQADGYDVHSQIAPALNALFVDATSGDHHAVSGAACVDAGTAAVSAVVTQDLDMVVRPQGAAYDVGAYEQLVATAITPHVVPLSFNVYIADDRLVLQGTLEGDVVRVYDMTGRCLATHVAGMEALSMAIPPIHGVVLVQRDHGTTRNTVRVVVAE